MRRFVVFPLASLFILYWHSSPCRAQDLPVPRFVRPTSGSLIADGWLEIAAVVPDNPGSLTLTLDGQPLAARPAVLGSNSRTNSAASSVSLLLQMGVEPLSGGMRFSPAWIAVREIAPGSHELALGPLHVRFRALSPHAVDKATSDALRATSTTLYVAHPKAMVGMVTCTGCHTLNRESQPPRFEDMTTFSPPPMPDICFRCHDQAKFLPTHAHRVEHLAFCQLCHDPHGSNRAKLMKLSREEACKKCHE